MGILASGFWLACCVHQVKEMTGEEGEMIKFYTTAWLHSFNTYESHEIPYLYDLANESCLHEFRTPWRIKITGIVKTDDELKIQGWNLC